MKYVCIYNIYVLLTITVCMRYVFAISADGS